MNELKLWLEERYGTGTETTVNYNGEQIIGTMYGNDECFDTNDFFQYLLTKDTLYKAYYDGATGVSGEFIPVGELEDLGWIDYENPIDLKDADAQYYIDYVI